MINIGIHDHYLFYASANSQQELELGPEEARHAASALRARPGDCIEATDGKGLIYRAAISTIERDSITARIIENRPISALRPHLALFVGLPDRPHFEELLALITPLGVSRIVPVHCRFCQKPWWSGKWDRIAQRFEKKIIAGIKQSLQAYKPLLSSPVGFAEALAQAESPLLVADRQGAPAMALPPTLWKSEEVSCFIGPPGGFSPEELARLADADAHRVWLSPNRLRTELAAAVMVAGVRMAGGEKNSFRVSR